MLTQYSHSSLGTFRTCPRKFKYQKIEKISIPKRTAAHTYLGNAVHHVLQPLYEKATDGFVMPLDDLLAVYDAEWQKPEVQKIEVTSEHMTVDDYIEIGRKMLREHYEKYKPFNQGRLLGAEMNIRFALPGTPFKFVAKVDRLMKLPDGTIEIADYKTGKLPAQGMNDHDFRHQMGIYQLAVQSNFPDFTDIVVAQYFLKHDEVIKYQFREDELDEMTEQLRVDVVATINAERLDDFPTQEGPLCRFCDYENICPAKRHRLILEAESGDDKHEKATYETARELADRYVAADAALKEAKTRHAALKEDIIRTAQDLDIVKLAGTEFDVTARVAPDEKLITKTADEGSYSNLSYMIREWGFEECFTLDTRLFVKEIYKKGRMSPEQLTQLQEYIMQSERQTVRIVKKKS